MIVKANKDFEFVERHLERHMLSLAEMGGCCVIRKGTALYFSVPKPLGLLNLALSPEL